MEKPNDPERIGYTFTGWYEDAGCTVPYNFKTKPTSDITLYAGWNINTYIINYETNGGSTVDDDAYNYGVQTSIPIEPEKDGYTFAGWYLDEELTELFSFGKMPAENITLYAKWNADSYTIRFVTNGGSAVEEITKEYGSEVSVDIGACHRELLFVGIDRFCWFLLDCNNHNDKPKMEMAGTII